jgi:phage tail-like protein
MTLASRHEGAGAYWFEIEVAPPGGSDTTWFIVRSVSGLGETIDMTDRWIGGADGPYQPVPGKTRWANIVLQGAVVEKKVFFDWFASVKIGQIKDARSHATIRLKHGLNETVAQWDITGAYPVKYIGPTLDMHSTAVAIETIELTHQGVKRVDI